MFTPEELAFIRARATEAKEAAEAKIAHMGGGVGFCPTDRKYIQAKRDLKFATDLLKKVS